MNRFSVTVYYELLRLSLVWLILFSVRLTSTKQGVKLKHDTQTADRGENIKRIVQR